MGWLYAIVGAVALLAAWLSPTIQTQRTRPHEIDTSRMTRPEPGDTVIVR